MVNGDSLLYLWYKCLGHPSENVLKFIPTTSQLRRSQSPRACDVCPCAKQHRDSFSLSETNVGNGTEFYCLHDYFSQHSIVFETSCVGIP